MNIQTPSNRCDMTYEHYLNQPNSMLEWKLNEMLAKNPHLINSLDRNKNHPLIRNYSDVPFKIYW